MNEGNKYSKLRLPFPSEFKKFCIYDLNEEIPFWVKSCLKDKSFNRFINLFDIKLEFIATDEATEKAIEEFSSNMIDSDALIADLRIPVIDVNLDLIITHEPTLNLLKKNNIDTVSKLADVGLVNLKKIKSMGISKIIYIANLVFRFYEETGSDDSDIELNISSNDEYIKNVLLENHELKLIYFNDPRFNKVKTETLIYLNQETISNNLAWNEILINLSHLCSTQKIKEIISKLLKKISDIKTLSLEDQMKDIFVNAIKNQGTNAYLDTRLRNLDYLSNRLGINQSKEKCYTLQRTADNTQPKVTRERIRQLESKILKFLDFQPDSEIIFMPKLNEIYKIFKVNLLTNENNLAKIIHKEGYGDWNISRLLKCFEIFNYPSIFQIHSGILNTSSQKEKTSLVIKKAKKIVAQNGLVELSHLSDALLNDFEADEQFLKKILSNKFIKISENWYFCDTPSNLLVSLAQRMANFSTEFDLFDLKEAHIKYQNLRTPSFFADENRDFLGFMTPPTLEISSLFMLLDDYEVSDQKIICKKINNPYVKSEELADSQFLNYFQARNFDCATFQEMQKYFLIEQKMKEGSFYQYLTYKPYIKRYARGVYGVCGKPPSNLILENAKNRIQNNISPKIEWQEDGQILIKVKLMNVQSFVFSLSDEYSELMNKDYFEILHRGQVLTKIKRSGTTNFFYGLGKYLSNILHCEIGDYIAIYLDISTYLAKAEIITEESFFDD